MTQSDIDRMTREGGCPQPPYVLRRVRTRALRQIRQRFAFYVMPSGNWKQSVSNLEYELSRLAPKTVKGMMPTVEEIEKRLTEMEGR